MSLPKQPKKRPRVVAIPDDILVAEIERYRQIRDEYVLKRKIKQLRTGQKVEMSKKEIEARAKLHSYENNYYRRKKRAKTKRKEKAKKESVD